MSELPDSIFQGYLEKQGHILSSMSGGYLGQRIATWTTRWFDLRSGWLLYYTDDTKDQLKGSFPINDKCVVEKFSGPMGKYENILTLHTAGLIVHLSANSDLLRQQWYSAIQRGIDMGVEATRPSEEQDQHRLSLLVCINDSMDDLSSDLLSVSSLSGGDATEKHRTRHHSHESRHKHRSRTPNKSRSGSCSGDDDGASSNTARSSSKDSTVSSDGVKDRSRSGRSSAHKHASKRSSSRDAAVAHLNGDEATPRGGSLSKDVKAFRKALADEQIVHKELLAWKYANAAAVDAANCAIHSQISELSLSSPVVARKERSSPVVVSALPTASPSSSPVVDSYTEHVRLGAVPPNPPALVKSSDETAITSTSIESFGITSVSTSNRLPMAAAIHPSIEGTTEATPDVIAPISPPPRDIQLLSHTKVERDLPELLYLLHLILPNIFKVETLFELSPNSTLPPGKVKLMYLKAMKLLPLNQNTLDCSFEYNSSNSSEDGNESGGGIICTSASIRCTGS